MKSSSQAGGPGGPSGHGFNIIHAVMDEWTNSGELRFRVNRRRLPFFYTGKSLKAPGVVSRRVSEDKL